MSAGDSWEGAALPAFEATGVAASFTPNRAHILGVTLTLGDRELRLRPPGEPDGQEARPGRPRWVFADASLDLDLQQFRDRRTRIRVDSIGEPPLLREVWWRTNVSEGKEYTSQMDRACAGGDQWSFELPPDKFGLEPAVAEAERFTVGSIVLETWEFDRRLSEYDPEPVELRARRLEAIEDRTAIETFFHAFDEGTAEGAPEWLQAQRLLNGRLGYRLGLRQAAARREAPRALHFDPIDPARYWRKYLGPLRDVSAFLVELAGRYLVGKRDYDLFDWAFEQFVTDEVVAAHYGEVQHATLGAQGAPDSLLYLRLAELGFFALENDVDTGFWRARQATFVRTAQVSLEHSVARVRPAHEVFPAPADHFRFGRGRRYPDARRWALRDELDRRLGSLDPHTRVELLEQRFGALLAAALRPMGARGAAASGPSLKEQVDLWPWGQPLPEDPTQAIP